MITNLSIYIYIHICAHIQLAIWIMDFTIAGRQQVIHENVVHIFTSKGIQSIPVTKRHNPRL